MKYISEEAFKKVHQGKQTGLFTLKNKNGLVAQMTNYGAIIVSIYVPDRNGNLADIVQGYDTIDEYIREMDLTRVPYAAVVQIVLRVANSILKERNIHWQSITVQITCMVDSPALAWLYGMWSAIHLTMLYYPIFQKTVKRATREICGYP